MSIPGHGTRKPMLAILQQLNCGATTRYQPELGTEPATRGEPIHKLHKDTMQTKINLILTA